MVCVHVSTWSGHVRMLEQLLLDDFLILPTAHTAESKNHTLTWGSEPRITHNVCNRFNLNELVFVISVFTQLTITACQFHTRVAVQLQWFIRMCRTHQQTTLWRWCRCRRCRRRICQHLTDRLDVMVFGHFNSPMCLCTWLAQPLAAVCAEVACGNIFLTSSAAVCNRPIIGVLSCRCCGCWLFRYKHVVNHVRQIAHLAAHTACNLPIYNKNTV